MKFDDRNTIGRDMDDLSGSEAWPLRLVVFGDFKPRYDSDRLNLQEPPSYAIDKVSFNEVLSKVAGDLPLRNQDSDTLLSDKQWIHVPLRSVRSFRPDDLVKALPHLRELLAVQRRTAELEDGKMSFEQFQSQVENLREGPKILKKLQPARTGPAKKQKDVPKSRKESAPKKKSTAEKPYDLVDSILGIVDLPDEKQQRSAAPLKTQDIKYSISDVGDSRADRVTGNSIIVREIIHELNRMLNAEVEQILHNPEFQRLESLWMGLKFLVDRTDFRKPISVEIRCCTKENLQESFALFENQVESGGGFESDTIVLAIYEFDRSSRDMKILQQLSAMAEILQVPVISSVGLDFLGTDSVRDLEQISALGAIFNQPQYTKWRSLRKAQSSRWLTLLFNRFLLRYPYGPDQVRVKSFDYFETLSASLSDMHLWGSPVWGMGSLLTKQFAANGNCLDITGWENGLIEDLPIREVQFNSSAVIQGCVDARISEDMLADLTGEGIVVLVSQMNADSAAILSAPTVHEPEKYVDEEETRQARLRASLPYQLFVSRIAACTRRLAGAIDPGLAPDTLAILIRGILFEFIPGKKDIEAITVNVKESMQFPDRYDVTLILDPERAGWRLPPVQLNLSVNR